MSTPIDHLTEIGACDSARRWVTEGKFTTLEAAWDACANPSWLLWYADRKAGPVGSEGRKKIVGIACECVRLMLTSSETGYPEDKRPRKAIEAAEGWMLGKVSTAELLEARNAARSSTADSAPYAAAVAYAAYVYAYARAVAEAEARAVAEAEARAAVAYAVSDCVYVYACVRIIKKHYPTLPS